MNKRGHLRLTRQEILSILKRNRAMLLKYEVKRIGLFGSYAAGQQGKRSDIDLLVEFRRPTFDNFMALHGDLERLFRRKIDLLTPTGVEAIRAKGIIENIRKSVVYA